MPVASRFNLVIPLAGTSDVLVFNTLRSSAALVDPGVAQALARGLPAAGGSKQLFRHFITPGASDPANDLSDLSPDTIESLSRTGAIVGSPADEDELLRGALRDYWQEHTLKLTLSYTAACQMRCSYCFQNPRNLKERHDPDLVQSTGDWVSNYLDAHSQINTLHLLLFGGEPLVNIDLAEAYIEQLQAIASGRDLHFTMGLTTNGINLTPSLIDAWAEKGLRYVRVTLDGPPAVHDARRPLASGAGTFHTIVSRLAGIADNEKIGVGVSINVDESNVDHVGELLDTLTDAGLREKLEIILEPTVPGVKQPGPAQPPDNPAGSDAYIHCQDVPRVLGRALDQVLDRGFRTPLFTGPYKPCNFVQSHAYTIDWRGRLFKCSFTMLDDAYAVGSVQDGVADDGGRTERIREVVRHCIDRQCAYLPVCGGGCRYQALWRQGSPEAFNCLLPLWDETAPASVAQAFGLPPVPRC